MPNAVRVVKVKESLSMLLRPMHDSAVARVTNTETRLNLVSGQSSSNIATDENNEETRSNILNTYSFSCDAPGRAATLA
jgi:hypothetical protein